MFFLRLLPGIGIFSEIGVSPYRMWWKYLLKPDAVKQLTTEHFIFSLISLVSSIWPALANLSHLLIAKIGFKEGKFCLLLWHMDHDTKGLTNYTFNWQNTLGGKRMVCFTPNRTLCLNMNFTISIHSWKHFQLIGKNMIFFFPFFVLVWRLNLKSVICTSLLWALLLAQPLNSSRTINASYI